MWIKIRESSANRVLDSDESRRESDFKANRVGFALKIRTIKIYIAIAN